MQPKVFYTISVFLLTSLPPGRHDDTCVHVAAHCNAVGFIAKAVEVTNFDLGTTNDLGQTILHSTCSSVFDTTATIDFLMKRCADKLDVQDYSGQTPLHCALVWRNEDVVRTLLKYKADVHVSNKQGVTPADIIHNEFTAVKPLLDER